MSELTPPAAENPPSLEIPVAAPETAAPLAPPIVETKAQAAPALRALNWRGVVVDGLLVVLIVIGLVFRFSWVNWNQDTDIHPDEYGLTGTLTRLAMPKSLDEYFNTRLSPISPYNKYDEFGQLIGSGPDNRMRWGQWPIILLRWSAELSNNTGYRELRLWGRTVSALLDSLTLFIIFLIGWQLYHHHRVGLIAAALSALAVMQIQQSHFMTADNFAGFFTALAMYFAVRIAQTQPWFPRPGAVGAAAKPATPDRQWVWYALFGLAFGMALASRINLAPLAGMVIVAAVIAYSAAWQQNEDVWQILWEAGWRLAVAGAVALITFRVTQPMSFRAEMGDTSFLTLSFNPDWTDSMAVAQSESNGIGGGPPGEQWTNRPALIFPWINMVLWGMGLPLGLTAWAGLALATWRIFKGQDTTSWKLHLLPVVWAGGYFLFMGTRWVKSVRYFLPIYPFLALLAAWLIWEWWQWSQSGKEEMGNKASSVSQKLPNFLSFLKLPVFPLGFAAIVLLGTLAWAWGFTSIYRQDNTRIQASRWIYQNIPGPLNVHLQQADGSAYTEPVPAPEGLALNADIPYVAPFKAQASGTVVSFTIGYARNTNDASLPGKVRVVLAADQNGAQPLAEAILDVAPVSADPRGTPTTVALGPATLTKDQIYYLLLTTVEGGDVSIAGSVISNENWDEGMPLRLDGRDAFGGLYRGLTMEVHWFDDENKRQMYLNNLAQLDYIILPSQRRIWSASRMPNTYPMTMEYYRALFDGRLGFDLVAQFDAPFVIGPLQVSDLAATWAWGQEPPVPGPKDYPFNLSPFAAEEAFSVYDHAPVWVFKKRPDFDYNRAASILYSIDLTQAVNQGPVEATKVGTLMMLPADRLAQQTAGGTWSAMFNFNSPLNQFQPLGVAVWWLAVVLVGWLAFPLTALALPGLADRGYAVAKTVGLLFVAWLVWVLGSYRILPHTQGTVALGFGVLALISAGIYLVRRQEINTFVRTQWRHLLIVEAAALGLFLFDLFIRWGNPDLWHPYYGGEKPMVFSFFNAILKSSYFPPYDPWLAGGYINYYYFGFVVVGLLTKLLGIVPAFAYNLILPTLFSLIGMGAFAVAYNLVAATRRKDTAQSPDSNLQSSGLAQSPAKPLPASPASLVEDKEGEAQLQGSGLQSAVNPLPASPELGGGDSKSPISNLQSPRPAQSPVSNNQLLLTNNASPYLAAFAAALLMIVLGNLGQVRTFLVGFQRAADPAQVQQSWLGNNDFSTTVNGITRVFTGQATFALGTGTWYWDATRIVPNINAEGAEITEFPFFTLLYADLHAHMMDLPFTLLVMAWAASYLLSRGRPQHWLELGAMFFIGGLAIGATRATNTWDFPTYLALGLVAVVGTEVLYHFQLSRAWLGGLAARLLVLGGLVFLLFRPFDEWFVSPYSSVERYQGTNVTLEAYLYIYGLFLFIIIAFLFWETRRWLAETPAAVLNKLGEWLFPILLGLLFVFALLVWLWVWEAEVAIIGVPLIVWAGLLILRSPQALSPAKRVALFLIGTALTITVFAEVAVIGGDRMNSIFKLYMQVWAMLSVAAGAGLAWAWAAMPAWPETRRTVWFSALCTLVMAAALYTVTAANAKINDRYPSYTAIPDSGCAPLPGMELPYTEGLPPEKQPHSLYGLDYMTWSAYCEHDAFVPLTYDHDAIRWLQDNIQGSPVIVEAQSFDLYRLFNRYTWNTGLPGVVGWDWHQRQERAAGPTEFIKVRGNEVGIFYSAPDVETATAFLRRYNVKYIIVGPLERAMYSIDGLNKFGEMVNQGQLQVVYQNPGVTIYAVTQ